MYKLISIFGGYMKDNFIREKIIKDRTETQGQREIIKSIIQTKQELDYANKNFEYAQGDLIDYYAYEIKANRAKLDYLMKKAKSLSIALDMVNELKIRLYEDEAI